MYHAWLKKRHYSSSTIRNYLSWVDRYLASELIADVFLVSLDHLSKSSVLQAASALRLYFTYLGNKKRISFSPRKRKPPAPPCHHDVLMVLGALKGKYKVAGNLIYGCGLRTGEVIRLRWEQIDLRNGQLTGLRTVPISFPPVVRIQLEIMKRNNGVTTGPFDIHERALQVNVKRASESVGVHLTPRDLRLGFMARLLEQGERERTVATLTGIKHTPLCIRPNLHIKNPLELEWAEDYH